MPPTNTPPVIPFPGSIAPKEFFAEMARPDDAPFDPEAETQKPALTLVK